MYRLPNTEDERIVKYVSQQLIQLMEKADLPLFYYPDSYPLHRVEEDWSSLKKLHLSQKAYTPELPMEYALFQLIMAAIEEGKTLPKIPAEVRLKLLNDYDE